MNKYNQIEKSSQIYICSVDMIKKTVQKGLGTGHDHRREKNQ